MNRLLACVALLALTLTVACGGQSAHSPVPTPSAEPQVAATFDGTLGLTDVPRQGPVSTLVSVNATRERGFDRVVFELAAGAPLPGYRIAYIDRPVRDCGSGETKAVAGDAWLEVRMSPLNAHTEEGSPTVPFREQPVELQVLRELERTCDFEAVTTWVLGLHSPNPYRVQELSNPPRLVIDVATEPSATVP